MDNVRAQLQAAVAGRFAVERELDRGGMARVFLARRPDAGEPVAIKVLRPEFARAVGADRFHREIALLGGLRHPHILPLLESGQAEAFPFYVMPYADGDSLRRRMNQAGPLPLAEALAVAAAVAAALDYAHAQNIIHRDIKPDNVLFASGRPVVTDFGVARAILRAGTESFSSSGLVVGTPGYMSPEQSRGSTELDGRSDLYALGCVVYEMLAGEPPFRAATAQALLARHAHDPPRSLRVVRPDVPVAVEAAVQAALAKLPEERPGSGAELVARLGTPAEDLAQP
ncbi:MAG: serine/threonine-protein kinase [Gemmatimonadales bacterium]